MTTAIFIGLWAYLFCMVLSEPGEVFGWLKNWIDKMCPEWLYKPLIGCPKCHAGQVAFWFQAWNLWQNSEFSLPFVLVAIATAYALQTWHKIVETWLHR